MRWGAFVSATAVVALIMFLQWPKMKQYPKKDKWAFCTLLFTGYVMSLFNLPEMAGPLTWIEAVFKPLTTFMEK